MTGPARDIYTKSDGSQPLFPTKISACKSADVLPSAQDPFTQNQWFTTSFTQLLWATVSSHLPSPGIKFNMDVSFVTARVNAQVLQLFLPFHDTGFPAHSHSLSTFPISLHLISQPLELHFLWLWCDQACSFQSFQGSYWKDCRLSSGCPTLWISLLPSFILHSY